MLSIFYYLFKHFILRNIYLFLVKITYFQVRYAELTYSLLSLLAKTKLK